MTENEYNEYVSSLKGKEDIPDFIQKSVIRFLEESKVKDQFSSYRLYKSGDDWRIVLYYKDPGGGLILNHEVLYLKDLLVTKHA